MEFLRDSLYSAILLSLSMDRQLYQIVAVSLSVSSISTLVASIFGIPLGFLIAFEHFRGKQLLTTILNTLLATPTVVIGLFVYMVISRRGVLGTLDLLYTKNAIIIGQTLLILPLITSLTIAAVSRIDNRYRRTALTLGANRLQTAWVVVREARFALVAAVVAAFGRVIAEVGISMMLGGNAKGFTRTMTTAMALEYDKGEFALATALGIILLVIAFIVNFLLHILQGRTER